MRIIIVEDEARALRGLRNLIESIDEKYEVIASAQDGQKALELIISLKPDIVFTDIKMPFMNGMDLIEAVRKYGLNTRFVITTAFAEFEYAKKAITLGVTQYLLKPVTYDEMEQVLEQLESSKNMTRQPLIKSEISTNKFPDAHYLIQKAIALVEVSFATKLNQEDMATQLGMTPEYFSYLFHKETGIKFSDYLRDYRIEVSKKILAEHKMKVNDVAYAVGYSDVKYFAKIFRKVVGETPTEYIKKSEEEER